MQVIITADDFGASASINAAVMRAHREGVLTSASLMVCGDAAEEAVALARATPDLAVGLHVVLAAGRPALAPEEIPHLVDAGGQLRSNPVWAGVEYALSQRARSELAREVEAQFARYAATGLPLDHVDGHLHLHLHPAVLEHVLDLAERYSASGVRVPRDDLWLSLPFDTQRAPLKLVWAATIGPLCRWALGRLEGRRLRAVERVYGLMQSGRMSESYVVRALETMRASTAEFYLHPDEAPARHGLGPNPLDLATLLSPAVRDVIRRRGLHLASYTSLD